MRHRAVVTRGSELKLPISQYRNFLLGSFSLTYGFVLQSLPLIQFTDRVNYQNYAENASELLLAYAAGGILTVFSNEPLWLLINITLAQFSDPEFIIRMVIFLGAARFSYVLTRADPKNSLWLILFLLMPQLLKNFITHLRQGLGLAIFFSGYFASGPARRWILMAAAPFVHASFFFILPIVILPAILRRMRLAIDVRLLVVWGFSLAASLSLGILAALLGARQFSNYEFAMGEVSGLGFVYWLAICGLFLIQGKSFLQKHQEAISVVLFYLVSYFFVEVASRIFESGMPLVLLAGLALAGWRRWAFISSFLLYSIIQWLIRLSTPMPF